MDLEATLKEIHVNADEPLKSLELIFGNSSLETWLNLGFGEALFKCLSEEEKEPAIISKSILAKFLPILNAIIPSIPFFLEEELEKDTKFFESGFDPALVDNLISKIISPVIKLCLRQRLNEPLLRKVFLKIICHASESTISDNFGCFLSEEFYFSMLYYFQPYCCFESHTYMTVLILLGRKIPEALFLKFLNPEAFVTLTFLVTRNCSKECPYEDNLKRLYNDLDLEKKLEKNVPTWISMHQTNHTLHEPDFTKVLQNISQYVDEKMSYRQFIQSDVLRKLEFLLRNPCESFIKSFLETLIEFETDSEDQYKLNSNRFENFVRYIANAIGYLVFIWDKMIISNYYEGKRAHPLSTLVLFKEDAIAASNILQSLYVLNSSWHEWFDILEEHKLIDDNLFISPLLDMLLGTALEEKFDIPTISEVVQICPAIISSKKRLKLFRAKSRKETNVVERLNLTISRNNVIKDMWELFSSNNKRDYWNLNFKDSIGPEPTKEVYSILSRELQRHDLNIWQSLESASIVGNELTYAYSLSGLFPQNYYKDLWLFFFLGRVIGKAILDGYRLDIHLRKEFFIHLRKVHHLHLRKEYFQLIQTIPLLKSIFKQLLQVKRKIETIQSDTSLSQSQKNELIGNLPIDDGSSFDDLHLNFTVPGTDIELIEGGRDIILSPQNIDLYLEKLCAYKVKLDPEDIEKLVCSEQFKKWTMEELYKNCVYELSMPTQFLFQCLNSFDVKEQRLFLKFVTGITTLPFGGLSNLSPPLTISRIQSDSPDLLLPSSATCSNCVYLPDYSSLKVTRENVLYAIREDHDANLLL